MAEPVGTLKHWLGMQMPSVQKKVKAVGLEEDEFPLHVGPSIIRSFYPRIPGATAPNEDMTVGRVCCSLTLAQAFWGGRHHFPAARMYLYRFAEKDVLLPSTSLTQEGRRGNEVWIVPHRMENWNIKPERVGEARMISRTSEQDEFLEYELIYVVKIDLAPVRFDDKTLLQPGKFYEFTVEKKGRWEPIENNKDIRFDERFSVKFKGEVDRDFWDRAALEYTVTLG